MAGKTDMDYMDLWDRTGGKKVLDDWNRFAEKVMEQPEAADYLAVSEEWIKVKKKMGYDTKD